MSTECYDTGQYFGWFQASICLAILLAIKIFFKLLILGFVAESCLNASLFFTLN